MKIQQKNSRVEKEQKKEQPESVLEKTISVVFLIPFSKRYVYNEKREVNEMNYTYILQCSDGTYYTGWTNDIAKRLKTHNEGKGAKYTRARLPVTLAYYEAFETKEEAMRTIVDYYVNMRGGKESPTTAFDRVPVGMTFQEFNTYINHQV